MRTCKPASLEHGQWAFTTYYASNWHPLTWLSHALDCQMFGLSPAGPHEINLLLQVVNVLLLFWVLQSATGRPAPSAMVAGLFALHPINVETVAWVAERKNLLSMLFLLLALAGYRWYVSRPGAGRYILVAVLFALGLMAKPQVITLPFLLLLWDYWPLRRMLPQTPDENDRAHFPARSLMQLVVEKLPLLAISAISAVITVKAQQAGSSVQSLTNFPSPCGWRTRSSLMRVIWVKRCGLRRCPLFIHCPGLRRRYGRY